VLKIRVNPSFFTLRLLLGLGVCAALTVSASAGRVNFDDLAGQLATELAKANVKSVAVADFLSSDGQKSDLGWYLARKLSHDLLARADSFRTLDRAELADTKISADDLASPDLLNRIHILWGVLSIVTGVVETSSDRYLVTVTLRKATDGTVIATGSQKLPHSRILDLLSPEGAEAGAANPVGANVMGVGLPACTYCPIPQYSDGARKAGIQSAIVVLMVTVSIKGTAEKISVVKSPGYGLAEQAIESVSEWKFRPASGKDGVPVAVAAPVEVSFHLFENGKEITRGGVMG
jgi:TonB family protein